MRSYNDDRRAQADRQLWSLVTKQLRASERHTHALSGAINRTAQALRQTLPEAG